MAVEKLISQNRAKNFAPGSPTNDVLDFLDIFIPRVLSPEPTTPEASGSAVVAEFALAIETTPLPGCTDSLTSRCHVSKM